MREILADRGELLDCLGVEVGYAGLVEKESELVEKLEVVGLGLRVRVEREDGGEGLEILVEDEVLLLEGVVEESHRVEKWEQSLEPTEGLDGPGVTRTAEKPRILFKNTVVGAERVVRDQLSLG